MGGSYKPQDIEQHCFHTLHTNVQFKLSALDHAYD